MDNPDGTYYCDCSNTGHHGKHCEDAGFFGNILEKLMPTTTTLAWFGRNLHFLWNAINAFEFTNNQGLKLLFGNFFQQVLPIIDGSTYHDYLTMESGFNTSLYARELPPIPFNCPRPMGAVGPETDAQMPDADLLFDIIFKRKKFVPNNIGSNVLFAFFAQHFTHQFFQTIFEKGPGWTHNTNHQVDMNQVYGITPETASALRTGQDGKLRTQTINGEEYPPYLRDVRGVQISKDIPADIPDEAKFALGHPFYALAPGLLAWQTIWVREHNRVVTILKKEHPHWDDERLYQTGKMILIGLCHKIVVEDYVQHLSALLLRLKYDPPLFFGIPPYGVNRYRVEFNYLYHWHGLVPDEWWVNGTNLSNDEYFFHGDIVTKFGLTQYIKDMVNQPAGDIAGHNFGEAVRFVIVSTIKQARELRLQPLNQYRKVFNLPPHRTFLELTKGDKETADKLEKLYGDINAVEMFPGYFAEPTDKGGLTPETITAMGAPYSLFGLYTHPISSPYWWKPSTFGGEVGMKIVTENTLQDFVCRNLNLKKGEKCPVIKYTVPTTPAEEYKHFYKTEL
jgi:prostaglandin-endoperoxide synthase 2